MGMLRRGEVGRARGVGNVKSKGKGKSRVTSRGAKKKEGR